MGKSSKTSTTQNTQTNLTQTPTNPAFVDQGLAGIGGKINDLTNADPYSFIAGPDPLQTQAGTAASGLTSPQGFNDAASALQAATQAGSPDISSMLSRFMNPYTDSVVNSSLAGFDQNSALTNAQNKLNLGNDTTFGGSGAAITDALTHGQQSLARGQLESGLRSQGFNTALQGATSQGQLDSTAQAQRIAAAQAASNNAAAQGNDARANVDTQGQIGQMLQQLAQQRAASPLSLLNFQTSQYGSLPLGLLHGQNTNGTENSQGTSNTKVSDPLGSIGSLLMGAGALGASGGLAGFLPGLGAVLPGAHNIFTGDS